jgi:Methyltransferase domain
MGKTMRCRICSSLSQERFRSKILSKYEIFYYACGNCGFLQTDEPFWLEESYSDPINFSDTGILLRTLGLAEIASVIIYFLFDKNARYLDFGGGYGLFTRRMRDIGFDFFWWDKYTTNLFATGFEYGEGTGDIELITAFETFEHFVDPIKEIETLLSISKNILLTTDLLPDPVPQPSDWYYYGLEHGQHISFYSLKTLQFIAKKYGLYLYSFRPVHLFTSREINQVYLKLLMQFRRIGLFFYIKQRLKSRTVADSIMLKGKASNQRVKQRVSGAEHTLDKKYTT